MYDEILSAGGDLIAVSPQTAEHSREFAAERSLRFPVLHDPGNQVADYEDRQDAGLQDCEDGEYRGP